MFDEYFNGATSLMSKSSVVPTTDASDKRHQTNITPSASTTIAADTTQVDIQTTPKPTTQAPPDTATENINQAEYVMVNKDEFINIFDAPSNELEDSSSRHLEIDGEMCMFALTVSCTESKNIKESMADYAWIEAMQEELHQFE
nr:hypothetical protein [Tanacetum cinerariifolium]